jgi:UDP-N-acetylglucosamine 2-epimerase (non-hydrolysing)
MKIINVVGARPNFVKIAPIAEAMRSYTSLTPILVHTGQHYDYRMSQAFFEDLAIPEPDVNLEVGPGSHAEQTGEILISFEKVCLQERPDLVLVVGDVNSTLACALAAKKLGIRIAHVEAGLRSGDMSMPEEINRLCTDAISDFLFTTDRIAGDNLRREGAREESIFFVGNVMIDTLFKQRKAAGRLNVARRVGVEGMEYAILTLHRPSNTDERSVLEGLVRAVLAVSEELPVVFPIHPRTSKALETHGLKHLLLTGVGASRIIVIEPLSYLDFLCLLEGARLALTDSGGLQEETTALGIPCLTLRNNTERPITCLEGTNVLVGQKPEIIISAANRILAGDSRTAVQLEKWDGRAAERIVRTLVEQLSTALAAQVRYEAASRPTISPISLL